MNPSVDSPFHPTLWSITRLQSWMPPSHLLWIKCSRLSSSKRNLSIPSAAFNRKNYTKSQFQTYWTPHLSHSSTQYPDQSSIPSKLNALHPIWVNQHLVQTKLSCTSLSLNKTTPKLRPKEPLCWVAIPSNIPISHPYLQSWVPSQSLMCESVFRVPLALDKTFGLNPDPIISFVLILTKQPTEPFSNPKISNFS